MRYNHERELNDPYFLNMHKGINEEAERWHLRVEQPFNLDDDQKDWTSLANYGAVLIEGEMTADAIKKIQSINPNVVFLDVNANIPNCNIIRNDFIEATSHILDKLYELGHRNIAFVGGTANIVNLEGKTTVREHDLRDQSYLTWMHIHKLDQYSNLFTTNWSADDALAAGEKILQLKERPTAVVVASDPMAIGLYKAFKNDNVKIPEDISLVSFDDVDINRFLTPTLSSVYMDTEEMGKMAVRLAKDLITNDIAITLTITCHSNLNLRGSVTKRVN